MADTPGNSGDQPAPTGPSAPEPASPDANQPPPWTPQAAPPPAPDQSWAPPPPPPAQSWAPPPPAQSWTPPPPTAQSWTPPQTPAPDQPWGPPPQNAPASQPWAPQPQPPTYGQPPVSGSGGRSLLFPIICGLLVLILIGVSAFSFMTITSTNKTLDDTKSALSSEQAARQSADAHVKALDGCVTAMKADETSLTEFTGTLIETQTRTATAGDVDAARVAYEQAVLKALTDEHQAIVNILQALIDNSDPELQTALKLAVQGENEMNSAKTLKTALDSLVSDYNSSTSGTGTQSATITTQLAKTKTTCDSATGGSPASSAAPAPSKSPGASPKASVKPSTK